MDNEDKLTGSRGGPGQKSREELIRSSWTSLKAQDSLTLKEKLEKLLAMAREAKKTPKEPAAATRNDQEIRRAGLSGFRVFENSFPPEFSFGKVRLASAENIGGDVLALLSRDDSFRELSLNSALFLDLETTGLSGGVGVIPFLIGLGFYNRGTFEIRQFFLGEPAAEEAMLVELDRFFQSLAFSSIITFNGKGFDLPILETRFTLYRLSFGLAELPHLDFVFPARQLWKHRHESCRLCHLAQEVLGANRLDDIPSSEVPVRYFSYLRSGDFSWVEPVLEHNQQDLLSLLGVLVASAEILAADAGGEELDGFDLVGLARIMEAAGKIERSRQLLEKALHRGIPEPLAQGIKQKLAWYWKKNRQWEKAVPLWEELMPAGKLASYRELAMFYEHRLKDYERARQLAASGLELAAGISRTYEQDFLRRLERLTEKIGQKRMTSK